MAAKGASLCATWALLAVAHCSVGIAYADQQVQMRAVGASGHEELGLGEGENETACVDQVFGWEEGIIQFDASSGGPQAGLVALAGEPVAETLWTFVNTSQPGVYKITADRGNTTWCLSVQMCGSNPALYECSACKIFRCEKEKWRVAAADAFNITNVGDVFNITNAGCSTQLALYNQSNLVDQSRCVPVGGDPGTTPVDLWLLPGFTGESFVDRAQALRPGLRALAVGALLASLQRLPV